MMHGESNRIAFAESAIAYFDGKKLKIVSAKLEGKIPHKPRGQRGFGWDPIFIPDGYAKTFSEMAMEEKSQISMRKIALEKLRAFLGNEIKS